MKYIHYSANKIESLEKRDYLRQVSRLMKMSYPKPCGLWVSCEPGYGWARWSKDNEFRLHHLKYQYQVKLFRKSNILRLTSISQMLDFTSKFKFCPFGSNQEDQTSKMTIKYSKAEIEKISAYEHFFERGYFIRWDLVCEKYDGILIYPYHSKLSNLRCSRQETQWYAGWDCSSGCIWNLDVIKEFNLVKVLDCPEMTKEEDKENEKNSPFIFSS